MTNRAIVFDLYGVLGLNGWQDFKTRHFDGRWEAWEPLRQLGQKVDAGEASEDEFVAAIAQATGETSEEVWHHLSHTKPNTELLAFIRKQLKPQYKIGILSNASRNVLSGIFTPDDEALFDTVVLSMHMGLTKPDLAMFRFACKKLGVQPEHVVFIDDQKRHLAPAKAVGMKPLHYESNAQIIADLTRILPP